MWIDVCQEIGYCIVDLEKFWIRGLVFSKTRSFVQLKKQRTVWRILRKGTNFTVSVVWSSNLQKTHFSNHILWYQFIWQLIIIGHDILKKFLFKLKFKRRFSFQTLLAKNIHDATEIMNLFIFPNNNNNLKKKTFRVCSFQVIWQ